MLLEIEEKDFGELGPMRTRKGWEVCGEGGRWWLRVPESDAGIAAMVPSLGRYRDDGMGGMVPVGKRLPVGGVPAGVWEPLVRMLPVARPEVRAGGRADDRVMVQLVPGVAERRASLLLTDLETMLRWAEGASRLRMGRLEMAVSGRRVLVRGEPLPPVSGEAWYVEGSLAMPCGLGLGERCWSGWVETVLGVGRGGLVLWFADGGYEVVPVEAFVGVTLGALRRTAGRT